MGIAVLDAELGTAAARLVRKGDKGLIRVSDAIAQRGRRQFSVAHEIGHWVLHKNRSQMSACTSEQMLASYTGSPPELEANVFAANLLMPSVPFVARSKGHRPSWSLLGNVGDAFGVSLTAAAVRYVELTNDYCALVVCRDGRIKWWRVSGRMQDRKAWMDAGSAVPGDSVAADCFRGVTPTKRSDEVPLDSWFSKIEGFYPDQHVVEEVRPMPKYRQVMSLLSLP